MGSFFSQERGRLQVAYAPKLFAAEGTVHIFVNKEDPTDFQYAYAC